MTGRELNNYIAEYPTVLARAGQEGWLAPLVSAHLTPCDEDTARQILNSLDNMPADIKLNFNNRWREHGKKGKGRVDFNRKRRQYRMVLPTFPGSRCAPLRVGLVFHEAAHIWDHLSHSKFGHGANFCKELREMLAKYWIGSWRNKRMTTVREIYDRHRGPYWLLLTRSTTDKKGRTEQFSDKAGLEERGEGRMVGVMSSDEAHEEARTLVNNPKENVVEVFVFSESEGQYTGARYRRGEEYPPWSQLPLTKLETEDAGRVELPDECQAPALLSGGQEPVPTVDAPIDSIVPERAVRRARPVRDVSAQVTTSVRTQRPPIEVDPGNAERWPASAGAAIVRAALEARGKAPAAELAQAIAADCAKAGIAFPASLISRLKQGGFLREVETK